MYLMIKSQVILFKHHEERKKTKEAIAAREIKPGCI